MSAYVAPALCGALTGARRRGISATLLRRASNEAAAACYRQAYLFSTDAGMYWSRQGFREVSIPELVAVLPDASHYDQHGWLPDQVAWCKDLIEELD